jgi:hypothetical protein
MIEYLRHNEIDKVKWDICVGNTPTCKPYGYSWYLDIMAPGWEALVDDDYDSVFPVPAFRKYGLYYIATPVFLQQLGIFSPDNDVKVKLNEYLEFMPDFYRLVDLSIAQPSDDSGFRVVTKDNYELSLADDYSRLRENYSTDCRRNIKLAAETGQKIEEISDPGEVINLFRNNKGRGLKGVKERDYQKLRKLMLFALERGKGRLIGVRNSEKQLIYGLFMVIVPGSVTLLFTATSEESREKRTGYQVIDSIIMEFSNSNMILDFAGSSIPSIADYNRSFGGVRTPYYRIYRNRLPWPVKMFK